jgi:hypothetical protein
MFNLNDDEIILLCNELSISDLQSFIETTKKSRDLCSNILEDKITKISEQIEEYNIENAYINTVNGQVESMYPYGVHESSYALLKKLLIPIIEEMNKLNTYEDLVNLIRINVNDDMYDIFIDELGKKDIDINVNKTNLVLYLAALPIILIHEEIELHLYDDHHKDVIYPWDIVDIIRKNNLTKFYNINIPTNLPVRLPVTIHGVKGNVEKYATLDEVADLLESKQITVSIYNTTLYDVPHRYK